MNFISHFFLDRQVPESLFFVGVSTPDLVSLFDRNIRVRDKRLQELAAAPFSADQRSFYDGVMRHVIVDKLFHTSAFFQRETREISRLMEAALPPGSVQRSFFTAHILFELALDKILIDDDPSLVPEYYDHLSARPVSYMVHMTEWVTGTPLTRYGGFLARFIARQYLSRYVEWPNVLFILKRILLGVGVKETDFVIHPAMLDVVHAYEAGLRARCYDEMEAFKA
ncbi:MAG: hypothetical protein SF053_15205 [Bacteroidia bacterium]|nr:hypothetical protein [Bacteroidia bacterium]